MKRLISFLILASLVSCAKPPIKEQAKVKEKAVFSTEVTDPELKVITNEYFRISAYFNLTFPKKVSLGFSDIDRGNVIGTCTFGNKFREIDLDNSFWKRASWNSKIALVYHEMTHCYCTREHDFGDGTAYPDESLKFILDRILNKIPTPLKPEGYLEDGCPKSIMHPIIVDNSCFEAHYNYYIREMFNRCNPWR